MIDEKVRVALSSKDETIETLRRELQVSNERYRQAEDLLESLNANLIVRWQHWFSISFHARGREEGAPN
jgi:flagellar motility protein MotE (MotC chaperone)